MEEKKKMVQWLVRNSLGKIDGPFSTAKVLSRIRIGEYYGDEFVSVYPNGEWVSISATPEFYDELLSALESEARVVIEADDSSSQLIEQKLNGDVDAALERTHVFRADELSNAESGVQSQLTDPGQLRGSSHDRKTGATSAAKGDGTADAQTGSGRMQNLGSGAEPDVIQLKSVEQELRQQRRRAIIVPALLIVAASLLVLGAWLLQPEEQVTKFHLVMPRARQPAIDSDAAREKTLQAVQEFQKDTYRGYLQAEKLLVQVAEGMPRNAAAYALLCLSYRELWPFTYQDSKDREALKQVVLHVKKLDPTAYEGALCEIVGHLLNGKYLEAKGLLQTWLEAKPDAAVLYEIRSELEHNGKQVESASRYIAQAKELWPEWTKIQIQEARLKSELGDASSAMQIYQQVLKRNSNHSVALIESGVLLAQKFSQLEKGLESILAGLGTGNRVSRIVEANAYFGVAEIYEQQSQKSKALKYAQMSYLIDPGQEQTRELLKRLGGTDRIKELPADPRIPLSVGDQYVRSGDCFAAQAQFKVAFEIDPKNGSAAMKAGKCLWELNQATEALKWLERAIQADPNLVEAYVSLADFQAQRFEYALAIKTLQKIQKKFPRSHEVYRGLAVVEIARNNFKAAVTFAAKSLTIYDGDAESYVVMARAQYGLGEFGEAQVYLHRALEIDPNYVPAQAMTIKVLVGLKGLQTAVSYAQELIRSYPSLEFRLALGDVYLRQERYVEAEKALRETLSLDVNNKRALMGLARAQEQLGKNADSLENYLKAAVLDPSDATPVYLAGLLYFNTGRFKESISQFERVLSTNPRFPRANYQRGRALLQIGNPDEAMKAALAEREANPEIAESYTLAAESMYALGQYANCASEYQKGIRKSGVPAIVFVRLARCYRRSGSLDSAISMLRQALSRESGNAEVYKELGAVYQTKAMSNEALEAYNKYLLLAPKAADRRQVEARISKIEAGQFDLGDE